MRVSGVHESFHRGQLAIAALFCSLGFQYATWASRLPALKAELGLTAAQVGVLLMAAGIGAAASFPLVSLLMKRLGSRRLALVSAVCLTAVLLALAAAPTYPVALLVMGVDGVLVGCLNVAMNAQGAELEARHARNAMARLHATFSGGALLAALLASLMTARTDSVLGHFAVAAAVLLLLIAAARTGLLEPAAPAGPATAAEPSGTAAPDGTAAPGEAAVPRRAGRWRLPNRLTLWMCCAMAFGTVTEGAMHDWSALYLEDVARASAEHAPLGIAVVSAMMVLARLFADGWRSRLGDGRVVLLGSALAGTGLAGALLAGGVVPALIGFGCVGLGIAAVTPCVYVAAARQWPDALTLVAAMGTTGLLAGPPLIGFIAGAGSLVWGMAAVAAAALMVSVCSTRIRWNEAGPAGPSGPEGPDRAPQAPPAPPPSPAAERA